MRDLSQRQPRRRRRAAPGRSRTAADASRSSACSWPATCRARSAPPNWPTACCRRSAIRHCSTCARRWPRNWRRCARCRPSAARWPPAASSTRSKRCCRASRPATRSASAARRPPATTTGLQRLLDSLVQVRRSGGPGPAVARRSRRRRSRARARDRAGAHARWRAATRPAFRRALARIDAWLQRLYAGQPAAARTARSACARLRTLALALPAAGRRRHPAAAAGAAAQRRPVAMSLFRTLLWWLLLAGLRRAGLRTARARPGRSGGALARHHPHHHRRLRCWSPGACCGSCCWSLWTLLRLPFTAWQRLAQAQARKRLVNGLVALHEGRHARAESLLDKAAEDAEIATVARLAAREAALRRGDVGRGGAAGGARRTRPAGRGDQRRRERCSRRARRSRRWTCCSPGRSARPCRRAALRLRGAALLASGRAAEALPLLPLLAREAEHGRRDAGRAGARLAGRGAGAVGARRRPAAALAGLACRACAKHAACCRAYAARAGELGLEAEAAHALAEAIERRWDEALVPRLRAVAGGAAKTRAWRARKPGSPRMPTAPRWRSRWAGWPCARNELGTGRGSAAPRARAGRRRRSLGRTRQRVHRARRRRARAAQLRQCPAHAARRAGAARCPGAACASRSPTKRSPSSATNTACRADCALPQAATASVRGSPRRPCRRRCRSRSARGPSRASCQQLRRGGDDARAGGGERMAERERGTDHVELRAVDAAQRRRQAEPVAAVLRPIPRPSACTAPARRRLRGSRRNRSPAASGCCA